MVFRCIEYRAFLHSLYFSLQPSSLSCPVSSSSFWIFNILHHIYDKFQLLREQHLNKLKNYALYKEEHLDRLKDIYSNLDKLERQYFTSYFLRRKLYYPFEIST